MPVSFPTPHTGMYLALQQAQIAYEKKEVPVGCVIMRGTAVIAKAHNLCFSLQDFTAHAELLAIQEAASVLRTPYLSDCTLYVTLEPCVQCSGSIYLSRIKQVIFGAYDPKKGAVDHGARTFCHYAPSPNVVGGVLQTQCEEILSSFFDQQRVCSFRKKYPIC
jgi:tRNA(adenine34) deaminase